MDNNLLEHIEVNETAICRVISALTVNDSEYSKEVSKINKYISEIEQTLTDNKELTPHMCDKILYIINNSPDLHKIEFNAMYHAGIIDAFKILNILGYIK